MSVQSMMGDAQVLRRFVLSGLFLIGMHLPAIGQSLDLTDSAIEADLLAVEVTGQLLPSEALAEQIQGDLAVIRNTYPAFADIRVRPYWMPGELLVGLQPTAFAQYENGTFTGFDPLFASLGVPDIQAYSFQPTLVLDFGRVYHGERLAELFDNIDGVRYAEPNYLIGDGDDIVAGPNRTYTLSRGSGDCPAGCISRQSWDFTVTSDGVFSIPELPVGDYDLDGDFDGMDFLGWQGMTHGAAGLNAWLDSYGQAASGANVAQVPEPTGLAVLQLALLGSLLWQCCRRQS
ncbi:MAG: hypothetical protein AAGD11_20445 [Planctomycetota bacterium]